MPFNCVEGILFEKGAQTAHPKILLAGNQNILETETARLLQESVGVGFCIIVVTNFVVLLNDASKLEFTYEILAEIQEDAMTAIVIETMLACCH